MNSNTVARTTVTPSNKDAPKTGDALYFSAAAYRGMIARLAAKAYADALARKA